MGEFQNRTLICSVLFIDIVEYSRKPVAEQGDVKERFNRVLSHVLRGVAVNDRIILDTGDGAAISFIGDPEDALFVAADLREWIASNTENSPVEISMRMGINLGPVRLVKDINGQPNIIGDGINVAQRVMTFAKPGEVLVSRSYYEVMSRLSDESAKLFTYEGSRTDKHIREHEVYAVGAIPKVHRRADSVQTAMQRSSSTRYGAAVDRVSRIVKESVDEIVAKPRVATAMAVLAILVIALGAKAYRQPDVSSGASVASSLVPAPAEPVALQQAALPAVPGTSVAAVEPREAQSAPKEDVKAPPSDHTAARPEENVPPSPREKAPPIPDDKASRDEERKRATKAGEAPAKKKKNMGSQVARAQPSEAQAPPQVVEVKSATLALAISPWGQIFVDGRMLGVSPPLHELELAPGSHRIEIRNSGSPAHVVNVTARPGERVRIKHKFN